MSSVFHRTPEPVVAVRAKGSRIYDESGDEYIDAASGAVVSNIGHGDPHLVAALGSSADLDYAHPSVFTTPAVESYATAVANLVPVDEARVYQTSGGAESIETALKVARSYHLAKGENRTVLIAREQSYHGNTIGALRVSHRPALRTPYEPWLADVIHVPAVNEYRCPNPSHPRDCADWHADRLEDAIAEAGTRHVAAFVGESIGGASLGAAVPPPGYWQAITEVCRRHGVLLIVDEVMTGFGRTGRWFAIEEWEVRPDILVSGKGAGAGYWPLGLCVVAGNVFDTLIAGGGFVHGFTYSHSPIGAAVGLAVLERIEQGNLLDACRRSGSRLRALLESAIGDVGVVGEIRSRGLLVGVEFVADRATREPISRSRRFTERLVGTSRQRGLLIYPAIGCADGRSGDAVLLAPPLNVTEEDIDLIVDRFAEALGEAGDR